MKKIIILLCLVLLMTGCTKTSDEPTNESNENATENINTEDKKMQIEVKGNGKMIVYELNDSQAAKDLYAQLPLSMEVENFSTNEKVFYASFPTSNLRPCILFFLLAFFHFIHFFS